MSDIAQRVDAQVIRLDTRIAELWRDAEDAVDIGRDGEARELIVSAVHLEAERDIVRSAGRRLATN